MSPFTAPLSVGGVPSPVWHIGLDHFGLIGLAVSLRPTLAMTKPLNALSAGKKSGVVIASLSSCLHTSWVLPLFHSVALFLLHFYLFALVAFGFSTRWCRFLPTVFPLCDGFCHAAVSAAISLGGSRCFNQVSG
jgi:hypothetical protein